MLGIRIVTKKGLQEIKQAAEGRALVQLIALLQRKDKIYLEPVTIVGGHDHTIQDCAFLGIKGTALTVKPLDAALEEATARLAEALAEAAARRRGEQAAQ